MQGASLWLALWIAAAQPAAEPAELTSARTLRLVPFPKDVRLDEGALSLAAPLTLEAPAAQADVLAAAIGAELKRAGLPPLKVAEPQRLPPHTLRLRAAADLFVAEPALREGATSEDYWLRIEPRGATVAAPAPAGLFYGVQTLCQLIRANRRGQALPCLTIRDWPSLRWRCFQDDLTRGPSARLDTLRAEVALGAELKHNLFTYYMEYQFAFAKHPPIGPPDGSLTPAELRELVAFGRPRQVDILGNQQSFGHFERILRHERYAALRENAAVLTPTKDETYQLLDDLYSEVCPLLPLKFFNVCCDETWGLGTGPSKELAGQIGVGGVYARHLRRVHDLLQTKYGKRMMMWGDIILQHPQHLAEIPKDTIMLTWGYDAKPSFENQIVPFARSGYEFFVCPGVNNWSRVLPDFDVATTNIRHFVRDGAKHGAIGMLNTEWKDDGESHRGVNWHGYAWGAECAWNAAAADPADFSRRVGAVLFGEPGDRFGQAIGLLAQTHRLPGMKGMNNARFWQNDFIPSRAATAEESSRLLTLVLPAIEHLEACRRAATVNAELLDACLLGARRMELIARRAIEAREAAELYAAAAAGQPREADALLGKVEALVRRNRDAHAALGQEFERIWLRESKPYALDWTMNRYKNTLAWYDALAGRLAKARAAAADGQPLPSLEALGWEPARR
jgi:hypothetical protein